LFAAEHHCAGAVAEQHAGGAVFPVKETGKFLCADDQRVFDLAGLNKIMGDVERIEKPSAGGRHVKRDAGRRPNFVLNIDGC